MRTTATFFALSRVSDADRHSLDLSTAVVVPAPETTDPKALLAHLSRHSPETLALAREWPAVIKRLPNLIEAIKVRAAEDSNHPSLGMMSLHYRTSSMCASVRDREGSHLTLDHPFDRDFPHLHHHSRVLPPPCFPSSRHSTRTLHAPCPPATGPAQGGRVATRQPRLCRRRFR